jgi:hypothetical protein
MNDLSPLRFVEWGHVASKEFLENGTSMNLTILKTAEANDLLPTQIQRICEVANHQTYAQLFKTATDKTFQFEVADPSKIITTLDAEQEKVAHDYFVGPKKHERIDVNKIFGVSSISNEPAVEEKLKQASIALQKLAAAKEELNSRQIVLRGKISVEEDHFYKMAKQMVLNGTPLEEIWTATRKLGDEDRIAQIFVKTAEQMVKEGIFGAKLQYLMKKHGEAVDPELISPQLKNMSEPIGVQVVNGSHPIVVSLNTLANYQTEFESNNRAGKTLDEKFVYVRNRMGDLNNSKKVDEFVLSEQQRR